MACESFRVSQLNVDNMFTSSITWVLLFSRIELRALEKIPEGQELTISYVDFLNLSADRSKKLSEQFHFECSCEHCSRHIKDDLMTAAAESEGSKVREEQREDFTPKTHIKHNSKYFIF